MFEQTIRETVQQEIAIERAKDLSVAIGWVHKRHLYDFFGYKRSKIDRMIKTGQLRANQDGLVEISSITAYAEKTALNRQKELKIVKKAKF